MEYMFKIVTVGDSGVGKSNILRRYVRNEFSLETKSTIGVEFMIKHYKFNIDKNSAIVKAQLWDTAGQERYQAISNIYYRGAVGLIVVYDITNKKSFENLKNILNKAIQLIDKNALILIIGNKMDLKHLRSISFVEGETFASNNNASFVEVSALDDINITTALDTFVKNIFLQIQTFKQYTPQNTENRLNNGISIGDPPTIKNETCCKS